MEIWEIWETGRQFTYEYPIKSKFYMVPGAGVEPALPFSNKILSLACLPISPPGQWGSEKQRVV
jgi:hypothetical protein